MFVLILPVKADKTAVDQFQQIDVMRAAGEFEEVWKTLNDRLPSDPGPSMLWRLARAAYDVGKSASDPNLQEQRFRQAADFGRRAVAEAPDHAKAHKWLAIPLGELAQISGLRERIELSREVRTHIERSLALDPTDDISHHVLARWHLEVATLGFFARTVVRLVYGGLPDASLEQAKSHLLRAIELQDRPFHHVGLGRVYHAMGRTEAAKKELRTALSMPTDFPHEQEVLEMAREMLQKW